MDLSIIIPCHNLEDYIEKCIDSILAQDITGYECEIIFVCDNCTDKTSDIIANKMIAEGNFQWTIWTCENNNPGQTRNVGLQTCQGDHLWFIDGDDWLLNPNAIQEIMAQFDYNNIDIVKFDYETKLMKTDAPVWRYVFKTSFLDGILFNNKEIFEDEDFIKEVKSRRPRIINLNKVYYHYNHPREGSIVTTYLKLSNLHGLPPWKR